MKNAVFITGYNNWGKTSIIQHLFNARHNFYQGWTYRINRINVDFTVETHSNDDYWGENWSTHVTDRLDNAPEDINGDYNLFTALCPTMEPSNYFVQLLNTPPFDKFDKKYVFLIENKWEHHAKLMIQNIISAGSAISNVNFVVIDADKNIASDTGRFNAKINQIMNELRIIFP